MTSAFSLRPAVRLLSVAALACLSSLAHATDAVEELRFYAPGSATVNTQAGTVLEGSDKCEGADLVCAPTLGFLTSSAGSVKVYADAGATANPVVYQTIYPLHGGLGVAIDQGDAGVSADTSVDQGESLSLLFANPVTVVGFDFFDLQHQAFAPAAGTTIQLLVDERSYTLDAAASTLPSAIFGREFTLLGGATSYYLGAVRIAAVPETSTFVLMGLGLAGVGVMARRRRRAA